MQEGMRKGQLTQDAVAHDMVGERRLWLAVVMQAVEEWRGGSLRDRRKAQEFIFGGAPDFAMVCTNAGLDPESLKSRLLRISRMVSLTGPMAHPVAA